MEREQNNTGLDKNNNKEMENYHPVGATESINTTRIIYGLYSSPKNVYTKLSLLIRTT